LAVVILAAVVTSSARGEVYHSSVSEVPDRIALAVGEQVTLVLPGLGTAGYAWDHEADGDPGAVDISWERGFPPETPPKAIGVSAPERITIVGKHAGHVAVTIFQHRRWEPRERARSEHQIEVVVS
jgi:predicted secreted protein